MSAPVTARPVRHRPTPAQFRRRRLALLASALLAGAVLVASALFVLGPDDYIGTGSGSVVVRVQQGDSTSAIGDTLVAAGVVKSRSAFVGAAAGEPDIARVQPGFYELRSEMSGSSAAEAMVDPERRVGFMDVRGGVQLDDTRAPNGDVSAGVITQISEATCLGRADDEPRCTTPDQLREAMAAADPAAIGVPDWAADGFRAATPERRLEGLIAPGPYNIDPVGNPDQVLREVLEISSARLAEAGLSGEGAYRTLVLASIVEKEGLAEDMPQVARVIENRLAINQRLEMDSTVNYPLDVQALRTTAEARGTPGPYNTYLNTGLPPTPVASVSTTALAAAEAPPEGPWLFFVRCTTEGASCFSVTYEEHLVEVDKARAAGAF
ncbi:endolytic transglycosylase MltG [Pseudonocardia nematodicida]|uniref:Endolytic murein transglycosylase n=1 Tax=Pseudonocardia nematodicida TaxID=1206997 RepID=A0ABV1K5R2_9PSEU